MSETLTEADFLNGHRSFFPESLELMRFLLDYSEVPHYHPENAKLKYMVPTPMWVKPNLGLGVFPGGPGTSHNAERFPTRGILVMAHDYDSLQSYRRAILHGYNSVNDMTFRDLRKMFEQSTNGELDLRECFFTNRFMGVRKVVDDDEEEPKNSQSGENPSRRFKDYLAMCDAVLKKTLDFVKPSLVIAVGEPASTTLKHGRQHWKHRGVHQVTIFGHKTRLICLTHTGTGFYASNVKHVSYCDRAGNRHSGHNAQLALIHDAWETYKHIKAEISRLLR